MMKKTLLFLLFCTIITQSNAQKELWGYKSFLSFTTINPSWSNGQIIKVPLAGNNSIAEVVHTFDPTGVLGKYPRGRLFQASNGKLYGVTGLLIEEYSAPLPNSVLFEYDLILNKYTVIALLNYPNAGVIEPLPGILMGTTNNGNSIYKYNFTTNVFSILASIPSFFVPDLAQGTTYYPSAVDELVKMSDGNLYYVTNVSRNNFPTPNPVPGGIYKYNMFTNTITKLYYFGQNDFGGSYGYDPTGRLVEGVPGKLYGTTVSGSINYNPNGYCNGGCGILYEFDFTNNILVQKYEYDVNILGRTSGNIVKVTNNKILGTLYNTEDSFPLFPYKDGMVYEYDISTSTVSIKHAINYQTDDNVYRLGGMGSQASDGNYYSNWYYGVYKYNPIANTIKRKIVIDSPANIGEMIEVCRKPSYQEIIVNTFTPAVGSTFTYNIQNTNATTYVWKKDTTVLPAQTTGTLTLTNVTIADTGVYTCTMTNECGTTVTANLNINVTNLAVETVDDYKSQISLYPNPTKVILNLKFPENRCLKATSYKITNLLGQIMEEKDISNSTKSELTINTVNYANGVYQITLVTDKGKWNGKFVKE